MNKNNVVLGLIVGAAAGAIAGILMAPDKGSKTRSKISGKGKEKVEGLKSSFDTFVDTLVNKFSKSSASDESFEKAGSSRK